MFNFKKSDYFKFGAMWGGGVPWPDSSLHQLEFLNKLTDITC